VSLYKRNLYLKAFSSMLGIMRANSGQASSKQGFVLISMSHGWNSSSIMKSIPKTSKLCGRRLGSSKW